jgi:prepilin-type N-terminal cleavage/methylation domain-containing protein
MAYQIKSHKKYNQGFSIVELLVVIGIISLLLTISTFAYNGFRTHENLEIAATGVVEAIRHAQANAQVGKADSVWGAKILANKVVIF